MARKKQVQVIEIDVLAKGLANSVKDFESMAESVGELGDKSKKVLKEIGKAQKLIEEFGEEMPVSEAKKLQEILARISKYSDDIANLEMSRVVTEEDTKRIKKYEQSIANLKNKIDELNKAQSKADYKKEVIKEVQGQKWISKTKDGKTERRSLESIKGWKTEKDLEAIANDPSRSLNDQRAAALALEKIRSETKKYGQTLSQNKQNVESFKKQLEELTKEYGDLLASIRTVSDTEKAQGETLSIFADKQADSLGKVIKANQELGKNVITTSKGLNKEATSLGGAVKALFSWTAAWNIGKRIVREAINTITEMDESLNGMAMVTGKSREEIDKLIPRIQTLAKDTSTAMTEIAGLITEYTKQGRTLQESFVLAEETAKAAKIAGISAAESIQYMTSAINGFNLAATDATRVSDVFANIAAISATDYEQLAIALSKVSAQANLAGMSMEYTTALLAKGIETTQEAPESIGTALKTIIARMRELTDYGKTLEDGASVNKVENALAAAGIELRNVNGEFRDLEEIFSELGPKWDHLNTMQQQAIAQAVAGTRQQSRFVAIMQDWERTQELAAEAQDSAGASAAQYAVLAEGMEAAMTNMKTSWQEFVQSLTESKTIIGGVNLITKFLGGITNILEGGGELTKTLFMGLTAIVAISTTHKKIKQALGIETDKEKLLALENLKIERDKLETDKISLQNKKAELEYQRQITAEILQQKQAELNAANADAMSWQSALEGHQEMDDIQGIDKSPETAHAREQLELQKQKVATLQEEINLKTTSLNSIDQKLITTKNQEANLNSQTLEAQKEYNEAVAISNHPLAARTELLIKELQVQKDKNDAEIAHLKTLKQTEDVVARIAKLEARNPKLQTRINNLEKQKNKILTKGSGIVGTVARTLSTTIQSSLQGVLSKLGPIGQLLGSGLDSIINWGTELLTRIPLLMTEFALHAKIKKEKKEIAGLDKAELVNRFTTLTLKMAEAKAEGDITDGQKAQLVALQQALGLETTQLILKELQEKSEKAEGKQIDKNNAKTATGIGLESVSALLKTAGKSPWPVALVLLALAGIAGAAAAGVAIAKNNSDENKENKIQESQNEMYNKKRQNKDLESKKEELVVLLEKDNLSLEEEEQLRTLEESIQGLDETLENKTGEDLLEGMEELQRKNEKLIQKEIESNYKLALSMKDLANSDLGQQAIEDKISLLQNEYIEDHESLMFATDNLKNTIEKQSTTLADSFAENVAYQEAFKYKEKEKGETSEERQARKEHNASREDRLAKYTEDFAKTSVDFVTDMEAFLSETDDQGKELHSFGERVHEYMKNVDLYFGDDEFAKQLLAEEYEGLAFIADLVDQETELGYKNSVLENIDKLTELGILTTDNIKELADMVYHFVEPKDDKVAQDLYKDISDDVVMSYQGSHAFEQFENELGISFATNNIEEIINAYNQFLNSHRYKSSSFPFFGVGEYNAGVFPFTKEEADAFFKLLEDAVNNGYGNLNITDLQNKKIENETTPAEAFNVLVGELLKIDGTNRVQGIYDKMLDSEFYKDIQEYEKDMNTAYENMASATTKEEHDKYMAEYKKYKDLYETSSKLFDDTLKSMTNYMSADQMYEVTERAGDAAKNVVDIREAALAGEGFSIEQLQKLENDIIPTLQAEIENFDASKFIQGLEQGTAESIAQLEQYQQFSAENTKQILQDNIQSHSAEIDRLKASLENTSDESEKRSIMASIENEKLLLSIAEQTAREYERQLKALKGMTKEERERYNRNNAKTIFERTHDMEKLSTEESAEYLDILFKQIEDSYSDLGKALYDTAKKATIDPKIITQYIKIEKGVVSITEAYDTLGEEQKHAINEALEGLQDIADQVYETQQAYEDFYEDQKDKAREYYEELSDAQQEMIDLYKNKLEEEQEALQDSLDKRKEMYEKYFDSLEEEDSDTDFASEQSKLQRAIASLASASDGASLARMKELQQELADLEEEQLEAERERRRENVMTNLDNESELVDQHYEDLLEDNRRLWEEITKMNTSEIRDLMTIYNDEWKNATDEQRKVVEMDLIELYAKFADLTNRSTSALDSKLKEIEDDLILAAGFSITPVTDKIDDIENYFMSMLDNLIAKAKGEVPKDNGSNKDNIVYEIDEEEKRRFLYLKNKTGIIMVPGYSKGGYVDYTGLAMVHGSPSRPEAFLNASQTALIKHFANSLEMVYTKPAVFTNEYQGNQSITIDNFTVAVDAELNNDNIQEVGDSLAEALFDGIRRSGFNLNIKQ